MQSASVVERLRRLFPPTPVTLQFTARTSVTIPTPDETSSILRVIHNTPLSCSPAPRRLSKGGRA